MVHVVVIGRRCDDDKLRGAVCGGFVCSCVKIESALAASCLIEEALDLVVLNWGDELVELLGFGGSGGDRGHFMILCEEDGQ